MDEPMNITSEQVNALQRVVDSARNDRLSDEDVGGIVRAELEELGGVLALLAPLAAETRKQGREKQARYRVRKAARDAKSRKS